MPVAYDFEDASSPLSETSRKFGGEVNGALGFSFARRCYLSSVSLMPLRGAGDVIFVSNFLWHSTLPLTTSPSTSTNAGIPNQQQLPYGPDIATPTLKPKLQLKKCHYPAKPRPMALHHTAPRNISSQALGFLTTSWYRSIKVGTCASSLISHELLTRNSAFRSSLPLVEAAPELVFERLVGNVRPHTQPIG